MPKQPEDRGLRADAKARRTMRAFAIAAAAFAVAGPAAAQTTAPVLPGEKAKPGPEIFSPSVQSPEPAKSGRQSDAAESKKPKPPLDALTPEDLRRFSRLEASRKKGLEAAASGSAEAYQLAVSILEAPAQRIDLRRISGSWRCRTFSLGGTLGQKFAASKTAFFRCRILQEGNGYTLRKLSGSMSWLGRLRQMQADTMLYYGTAIARGDRQPIYPEKLRFGSHQVGILQQIGRDRLRIEMPEPSHFAQSFHDLIELVREQPRRRQ